MDSVLFFSFVLSLLMSFLSITVLDVFLTVFDLILFLVSGLEILSFFLLFVLTFEVVVLVSFVLLNLLVTAVPFD